MPSAQKPRSGESPTVDVLPSSFARFDEATTGIRLRWGVNEDEDLNDDEMVEMMQSL